MSDEAGRRIGKGIAWLGFWLMIGLTNFGGGFNIKPMGNAFVETIDNFIESK